MNSINEIKEMLDKLNEELESLRAENYELKYRLSKYESVEKIEKDYSFEMSSDLSKDELYELGKSIINHTTKNEIQAITQLMYCWENHKIASNIPVRVVRAVIDSNSLSEKGLDAICKYIVSAIAEKFTSRSGEVIKIPQKYRGIVTYLLEKGNLCSETYETLLDIYFEHTIKHCEGYWRKEAANLFAKSSRYNVVENSISYSYRIEKKL